MQCALSKYAPRMILSKLFNDCMISSQCLNAVKTEGHCSNHPYLSLEPQWECHLVCIPEDQCTSMYWHKLISWRNMFLLLIAGSMLHAMFSSRFDTKPGEDGSYFIDRDGTHFRYILNYLRTGELIVPNDEIIRRELLAEAKFYQVEEMINELEPTPSADSIPAVVQPFKDSVILSSSQGQTLMNWLKSTPSFSNSDELLLYRASRDGWASSTFHSYCDNKGPTVTVIKSGNNIFGGYTEQSWQSKS